MVENVIWSIHHKYTAESNYVHREKENHNKNRTRSKEKTFVQPTKYNLLRFYFLLNKKTPLYNLKKRKKEFEAIHLRYT